MGNSQISLPKTCSSCGQQKPLTAFLQLSGPEGASYGNICSDCRKAGMDKSASLEKEESTTSSTGFQIDTKAKLHADIDKKQVHKEAEEQYHEERDENAQFQEVREQKVKTIAEGEKKHRQSFYKPFLDDKKSNKDTQAAFGSEEHLAKEGHIDLTGPVIDPHVKEKFKSAAYKQLKYRLGTSSPIARAFLQSLQKDPKDNKADKETLTEVASKKWGPSSRS